MLSSSSELTKTLLTRSELKSLKDFVPNRSHTFACLIVKELGDLDLPTDSLACCRVCRRCGGAF